MSFHLTLKKYRVIYVTITAVFLWLAIDAWDWYKLNFAEMTEYATVAFVGIYASIIGALKYSLENSRQDDKHD